MSFLNAKPRPSLNLLWPCLCLLMLVPGGCSAQESPQKTHTPPEVYQSAGKLIAQFLEQQHFAKKPLDETTSTEWIENYMKGLDYNHLFFLQSDLDSFKKKYSGNIAERLKTGDLQPAFEIQKVLQSRLDSRITWINKRIDQPFDFNQKDSYIPDRSKVGWPTSEKQADEIWEHKIKYDLLAEKLGDKKEKDPKQKLKERYNRIGKYMGDTTDEEIIETYLSSLTTIYDPHSQYLSPDTLEDFAIKMNNSLVGIGAVLSSEEGYCTIKEIIPGGPAALDTRLKVNDKIIGVAQGDADYVDIVDMKLQHAVRLIRGEKSTVVRLKIIPSDAADSSLRKEIKLVRDEIQLNQQRAKAQLIEQPGPDGKTLRIGVIDLPSFYGSIKNDKRTAGGDEGGGNTTDDVAILIKALKKKQIDGLVLDLRNNGGGLLGEAVRLVGLFIDQGPVVQVRDSMGRTQKLEDTDNGTLYDGPLLVLTNKLSASASEIAAGALQNYGRAVVVGDQSTHGKGTVQTVTEISNFILPIFGKRPDAGAVKLTIQKFYLPNGHSTQNRGVIPDISLPSANDYLEYGEEKLPHALQWDEIPSAEFKPVSPSIASILPNLAADSSARIKKDEDFKILLSDIDRMAKRLEDKSVSLNEQERVTERAEDKARREQRKEWVREMAKKSPSILNITFDNLEGTTEAPKKLGVAADSEDGEEDEDAKDLTPAESFAADLHLRESIRILTDLISREKGVTPTVASQNNS